MPFKRTFSNAIEPAAIVLLFTIGALVNRRKDRKPPELPQRTDPERQYHTGNRNCKGCHLEGSRLIPRKNFLTRLLAHFPFLLEIVYWLLIYWIYQGLRALSAKAIRGNKPVFDIAERHGLQILAFEHLFHLDIELEVQKFVLTRVPWLMKILSCVYYSHIVLGVGFYVYCYTFFQRSQYQRIRRTMALENIIAFTIFTLWRCMPPRLLPAAYGFIDVLHQHRVKTAWTHNRFQLIIAAMPSLHFGNSVLIAYCLMKFSPHRFLRILAPFWPTMMGLTIVATANHYILDAVAGACVITIAYQFNHIMLLLLPVEGFVFRVMRLEKPKSC